MLESRYLNMDFDLFLVGKFKLSSVDLFTVLVHSLFHSLQCIHMHTHKKLLKQDLTYSQLHTLIPIQLNIPQYRILGSSKQRR